MSGRFGIEFPLDPRFAHYRHPRRDFLLMRSKVHGSAHTGHFPGSAPSQIYISPQVGKRVSFSQVPAMTAAAARCWTAFQAADTESADQPPAVTEARPGCVSVRAGQIQRCGHADLLATRRDTLATAPVPRLRRPLFTRVDLGAADSPRSVARRRGRDSAQYEPTGYGAQSKAQRGTYAVSARIPAAPHRSLNSRACGVADTTGPSQSQFIGQWRDRVELDESTGEVMRAL